MLTPAPTQANYPRMLGLLLHYSLLTPLEDDPQFVDLLRHVDALERILAMPEIGYDVLKVDNFTRNLMLDGSMGVVVARCTKYLADKNRTPESDVVDTTEQRLLTGIVDVIKVKNANYGESWSRRGGQGAFFSYVRKTDRLHALIPKVLAGEALNTSGDDDFDDTFVDIIGYLGLFLDRRQELYAAQQVEAPSVSAT